MYTSIYLSICTFIRIRYIFKYTNWWCMHSSICVFTKKKKVFTNVQIDVHIEVWHTIRYIDMCTSHGHIWCVYIYIYIYIYIAGIRDNDVKYITLYRYIICLWVYTSMYMYNHMTVCGCINISVHIFQSTIAIASRKLHHGLLRVFLEYIYMCMVTCVRVCTCHHKLISIHV